MTVPCYVCFVENGRIKSPPGVVLPEQAKVYVLVPATESPREARVMSPRLARPEQAKDFVLEVLPQSGDEGLCPPHSQEGN
jgi:hypothetical protein